LVGPADDNFASVFCRISGKFIALLLVYIMARISTIYGNQIVTEYLVFIVFIIDYKSGIRDRKLGIITCI